MVDGRSLPGKISRSNLISFVCISNFIFVLVLSNTLTKNNIQCENCRLIVFAGYLALVLLTPNQLYRYEVSAQTLLLFAIVRYFVLHLAMQSVPLTTNVNYIPVCGEVYSIQLYMIILEHWFDTDRWFSSDTLVFHAIQTGRSDHLVESGIKRPYHFNCAI